MEQQHLFDPDSANLLDVPPDQKAAEGAKRYTGGSWSNEGLEHTRARGGSGHAMYRTFANDMGKPTTDATRDSFEAMRTHLSDQFSFMTRPEAEGGLGINVESTPHDPYGSFEDMQRDVSENSRLRVFSTASTGGHAFFTDEENDQFRAVHDYFGHVATGRGFDRHGEEAAYRSHAQMFPPEARSALASETRGQNSYLNWGGGDFPDQSDPESMVGAPEWMSGLGDPQVPQPKKTDKPQGVQGTLF